MIIEHNRNQPDNLNTAGLFPTDYTAEASDSYKSEVTRSGRYRIALCKDGIQWLLQKQDQSNPRGKPGRWRSFRYYATRSVLVRDWHRITGEPLDPEVIAGLPERAHLSKTVSRTKATDERSKNTSLLKVGIAGMTVH